MQWGGEFSFFTRNTGVRDDDDDDDDRYITYNSLCYTDL